MKKIILFVILILIILFIFFPPKKMENRSGMVPSQFSFICKGFFYKTYDKREVDGGVGGYCFGKIKQKENLYYQEFLKHSQGF